MDEYHVDRQDWRRWPKALIMRRVWSTNGHNRHREVRRYVPEGHAAEVERENESLRKMVEHYRSWTYGEVLDARRRENRERASADRLRERNHDIAADRERLKAENAKLRELVGLMDGRDVLLPCWRGCDADCRFYDGTCERIGTLMGELGFEVDE